MLDAEAPVARAVLLADALEDVEQRRVGAVADGVHDDVEAGLVGARDPGVEVLGRGDEEPAIRGLARRSLGEGGRVRERLVERRGVRAERAVDEPFQRADPQPRVAASVRAEALRRDGVAQPRPRRRAARRRRCASTSRPARHARSKTPSSSHVPMWWTAVTPCAATCFIAASSARSLSASAGGGTFAADQVHRVVLQQPGRLPRAVAHDLAAGDVGRPIGDAGRAQRRGVRQRHVAVEPVDPDRDDPA